MSLEEVTADMYRAEEMRMLDGRFKEMLDLDCSVAFHLGRLEYENAADRLVIYAREFGFFVGVKKDRLEREAPMNSSTYGSMVSYGYVSVIGSVNGMDIITPTPKLLQLGHVSPKT